MVEIELNCIFFSKIVFSVHRIEQSLVCSSFRLFHLRQQDDAEIEILRIRRETGVQEMLREIPERVATPFAVIA